MKYLGLAKNMIPDGLGIMMSNGKLKSIGRFKDSLLSGLGRVYSEDGLIFDGEFNDSHLDGVGFLYSCESDAMYEGVFTSNSCSKLIEKSQGYSNASILKLRAQKHLLSVYYQNEFQSNHGLTAFEQYEADQADSSPLNLFSRFLKESNTYLKRKKFNLLYYPNQIINSQIYSPRRTISSLPSQRTHQTNTNEDSASPIRSEKPSNPIPDSDNFFHTFSPPQRTTQQKQETKMVIRNSDQLNSSGLRQSQSPQTNESIKDKTTRVTLPWSFVDTSQTIFSPTKTLNPHYLTPIKKTGPQSPTNRFSKSKQRPPFLASGSPMTARMRSPKHKYNKVSADSSNRATDSSGQLKAPLQNNNNLQQISQTPKRIQVHLQLPSYLLES